MRYMWLPQNYGNTLKKEYLKIIPIIRKVARSKGYAIGVHGSLKRDLDLIAVPWVKKVSTQIELVKSIQISISKIYQAKIKATRRPRRRTAYTFFIGRYAYIDISVSR